ncbi:YggS family pyridoxal phosphate-dependent enzyme [Desemzia sp. RIT804]|uniref:YggS family pyridoxal phosphate-dependent enzyme n=1 Tax=Desemzia sp. RIT 804 TaxID=2810209 RepID=UPI0019516474|nr:YggS family pyridoxal phosphate-dependent enzyme [Desemzia sp. RIT 804]MBM6613508.1 YggS family pyridoxal phosphate-dependent enzyme [Desemzia sp. RIT 804]
MNHIEQNVHNIEDQLKKSLDSSKRDRVDLRVVVVTKYVSIEEAEKMVSLGYKHLGENRPEGLIQKQAALQQKEIVWHYIGSLQTRKVKQIINHIDYLHSLDRMSLAEEIEKRAEKSVSCFLQVNISGEESKSGFSFKEVMEVVEELSKFEKIKIVGLMTMAPKDVEESTIRKVFSELKKLQEKIVSLDLDYAPCTELSMGMSQDYPIAIEEGATFVRIGSAFFKEIEADKT